MGYLRNTFSQNCSLKFFKHSFLFSVSGRSWRLENRRWAKLSDKKNETERTKYEIKFFISPLFIITCIHDFLRGSWRPCPSHANRRQEYRLHYQSGWQDSTTMFFRFYLDRDKTGTINWCDVLYQQPDITNYMYNYITKYIMHVYIASLRLDAKGMKIHVDRCPTNYAEYAMGMVRLNDFCIRDFQKMLLILDY
jgi:hypothetical protein